MVLSGLEYDCKWREASPYLAVSMRSHTFAPVYVKSLHVPSSSIFGSGEFVFRDGVRALAG
jgi:hypothetical protein